MTYEQRLHELAEKFAKCNNDLERAEVAIAEMADVYYKGVNVGCAAVINDNTPVEYINIYKADLGLIKPTEQL